MNRTTYYTFFILIYNLLLSNVIDHQPKTTINYKETLELQVFSDYPSADIIQSEIYFKSDNQLAYLKENLLKTSDNYFNVTIPSELILGEYINYYFVFKFDNGELITIPPINPHNNPYSTKVIRKNIVDSGAENT